MKTILLTLGDAAGIGPEVIVKCLAHVGPSTSSGTISTPLHGPEIRPVVIGELDILRDTAESLNLQVRFAPESEAAEGDALRVMPTPL